MEMQIFVFNILLQSSVSLQKLYSYADLVLNKKRCQLFKQTNLNLKCSY